ncbi:MAG: hypothetical protein K2X48_14415 [Chitinophagaceae bacterium]|nr:hypothetical protein [Chitinophagaceae bacterium]
MKLIKLTSALLLLLICGNCFSQQKTFSIPETENKIHFYVSALAHDSMQGRETGTEGMMKAARFITAQMKSIALQPVKGNDGYC